MLQAIDCLATENITHRDLKPENIFYVSQPNGYCFQLGNFGLCNLASVASTRAGSPLYMAPEMFQRTTQVDVWSLFVTMLWTLDVRGFRQLSDEFQCNEDVEPAVLSAADGIFQIREMVVVDPEKCASAAQMLIKCFNGQGLTTPRHMVPALIPPQADIAAPVVAAPTPRPARSAQRMNLMGFEKI